MNKQFKISALAVAIGVFMAVPSAFAEGTQDPGHHHHHTDHAVSILSTHQVQVGQAAFSLRTKNTAGVGDNSSYQAKGNIGENMAAGSQNMQGNNLAVSTADGHSTSSFAGVFNDQDGNIFMLTIFGKVTNTSYLNGNALRGASGNIGVNIASGAQNMQGNNAAIANGAGTQSGGDATSMIFSSQSGGPLSGTLAFGTSNKSWVGGNALRGASGNIGVNVATGAQNVQGNDVAISRNHHGNDSYSVARVSQVALGRITGSLPTHYCLRAPVNTATVGGNSLRGASGNIGMNVAAGYGNLQSNTLTISNSSLN